VVTVRDDEHDLERRRAWEWRPGDSKTDSDRCFDRCDLAQQGLPFIDRNGELVTPFVAEDGRIFIGVDPGSGDTTVATVATAAVRDRVMFFTTNPAPYEAMAAAGQLHVHEMPTPLRLPSLAELQGYLLDRISRDLYGVCAATTRWWYLGPNDPGDEHVPDPRFPRTEADACVTDLELLEFHLRDVNPKGDGAARRLFAAAKLRRTTARDIEARLLRELERDDY